MCTWSDSFKKIQIKRQLIVILLLCLFNAFAYAKANAAPDPTPNINCKPTSKFKTKECQLFISSKNLQSQSVYVKAWVPLQVTQNTQVILFLHGLGYSLTPESSDPTMIEVANLKDFLTSEEYQRRPAIILSPQDLFYDQEGKKRGEDYWLGRDGRDWESFFVNDLKPYIQDTFNLNPNRWFVLGISMGAQGAMKLALDHQQHFKAFAAISPVFRSTSHEIQGRPALKDYSTQLLPKSMGVRLIHAPDKIVNPLLSVAHRITIHENDFSLKTKDFPLNQNHWAMLMSMSKRDRQSIIEMSDSSNVKVGHSFEYWKTELLEALQWFLDLNIDEVSI